MQARKLVYVKDTKILVIGQNFVWTTCTVFPLHCGPREILATEEGVVPRQQRCRSLYDIMSLTAMCECVVGYL